MIAGEPAHQEGEEEPDAEQHGRREVQLPPPHRADPVEELDAGRHGDEQADSSEKKGRSTTPVVNMWCAHTPVDSAAMDMVAKTMPL